MTRMGGRTKKMDLKPIVARVVAAGLGLVTAKLASKGIAVELSPEVQASIVVGVYGALHSISKQLFGRKK